ncbi:FAD-dependent monooxygenase [Cyanobium sp. CH-040]|nr:FAD-dependent monooxygenase [Cyanobium sp. CH-040]
MPATTLRARVCGGGPTGALSALALADAGWRVSLHDPLSAGQLLERSRAYAFNHSSRQLLERLGLWDDLAGAMVPFSRLELRDLAIAAGVPFSTADLPGRCRRSPWTAVGWVGLHGPLMTVLLERLQRHPAVDLQLGTTAAPPLESDPADLVVAADGPHSSCRDGLGIGLWQLAYRQACLTAQVELRGSDDDQAWELFRPEGPFALLPLGRGRFQLVWSAPAARCRQLESLSADAFLDRLAGALPDRFQPDALLDEPRAFPVALQLARRLAVGRTVLVGESAHRCHPVGGQGLNLCWRDVAELHRQARRVAAARLAADRLPAAYAWRRWPDLLLTLLATDLLMRLFSNRAPLLLPLRRLGLILLAAAAPLRRLSLGVMTLGPCRPL